MQFVQLIKIFKKNGYDRLKKFDKVKILLLNCKL